MSAAPLAPVLDWFAGFGRRWGLEPETCRLHAWLYLKAGAIAPDEAAAALGLGPGQAKAASADLAAWGLLTVDDQGRWRVSAEPFDFVFGALEARRRRELPLAEAALAGVEVRSLSAVERRQVGRLAALFADLAALDLTAGQGAALARRALTVGGRAARLITRLRR